MTSYVENETNKEFPFAVEEVVQNVAGAVLAMEPIR